jgi:TnpA family transposase
LASLPSTPRRKPAERESAYVIDGIMRNDVVKSDIHSTDTHGYSEVIFGATFGLVEFAPRIKGVGNQQLYAFQKRKHYEELGYKLLPDRYIQSALIEEQWDEILRFLATIQTDPSRNVRFAVCLQPLSDCSLN